MECVYLGIIIQISVNRQSTELREVEEEVHIIHGDVEVLTHKNTSGEPERASGT